MRVSPFRVAVLVIPALLASEGYALASSLTADTGSATSLFTPGQTVPITFNATGASGEMLTVTFQDADGKVVTTQTATVSGDPWSQAIDGPSTKLGFYRVYGTLSDGTTISPVGSRAEADGSASFATYAVVPDPATRLASPTDDHAFFGMAAGFNVGSEILAQLGIRWIKDSQWSWSAMEPYANQRNTFAPTPSSLETGWTNGSQPWVAYSLPNLTVNGRPYGGTPDVCVAGTFAYNTCAIDPSYDQDWETFVARVATDWPTVYPARKHRYYEMTWEPIYPWGYLGTPQEFVNLYELAVPAMKAADPNALIVGPTMFVEGPDGAADEVLADGLAQYLDVFSTHPYVINDVGYYSADLPEWGYWDPELGGVPPRLSTTVNKVTAAAGHPLPIIGTEQGYPTHQQVTYEIDQARRLIRQNLILLGEGWKTDIAFVFADYPSGTDSQWMDTTTSFWDYGFFYNLDEGTYGGYGPSVVSPKPVAAAYAAMTLLLDNRQSVNIVNWLGDTTRGYVYESYDDATDEVLALWDFSGSPVTVTVDTGAASVEEYDWMGNATKVATSGGKVTLTLTNEPTYVKGLSAALWGSARTSKNVALGRVVTTSGDASSDAGTSYAGSFAVDGDPWANESRWVSTDDASDKWISVDLGTATTIDEVRFFTGEYVAGAHANFYGDAVAAYHVQSWTGSTWTDVVARTANTRAAVDEVFTPVTTSKVRLYFDAGSAASQVMIYEVEVLTVPAATSTDGGAVGAEPSDSGTSAGSDGAVVTGADGGDDAGEGATAESRSSSGCGCVGAGSRGGAGAGVGVAGLALLLVRRRRRST
jgi:MYXO-CTERM domain-containing protein